MSEDLIKREDAIEALYKYSFVSKDVIEKEIKAIPSADRPQGEWVDGDGNPVPMDKYGDVMDSAFCTNCGDWLSASDEYAVRGYFCPNCGARMKGADDE